MLYPFKDRQMLPILAPVDGEPVHLCGICGFVLSKPGETCPRCAEDIAAAMDGQRAIADVEEWLQGQKEPHTLEAELAKLQTTLDALEACPPLWWPDRLLWRGLRWFYRMRQWRVREAWEELVRQGSKEQREAK